MFKSNFNIDQQVYYWAHDPMKIKGEELTSHIASGIVQTVTIKKDGVHYGVVSDSVHLSIPHDDVFKSKKELLKDYSKTMVERTLNTELPNV